MKIIFMGTSQFAVPALHTLSISPHEIVAVFTKEPQKSGRGHKVHKSAVHLEAEKINVPIFTPRTLKSSEIVNKIRELAPDITVVTSYGHIIPQSILDIPRHGCLNIHPSLLPRWRGAAPIERTILAGDKQTAVCIMKMDAGLDTGPILAQRLVEVDAYVYADALTKQLAAIGAEMLLGVIEKIDTITPIKQSEEGITYAHKLTKEEAIINWHDSAAKISRMIRAFNPWPGCFFSYNGEQIKIIEASFDSAQECSAPGTVLDKSFTICCGDGVLRPTKLQRPGKNVLSVKDFLNGLQHINPGTILQ